MTSKGAAMSSSGEVLATIPVGMLPKWIAVGPDGTRAYVTMSDPSGAGPPKGAVAVIDTTTNTLTSTIAVGILPSGVVVAPDGGQAYVPNLQHDGGLVSVIDTKTNAVVDTITVTAPTGLPQGAAITLDGRQLYVPAASADGESQGTVKIIDAKTKAIIASIALSPCESAVAITPDGRFVYVLDSFGFGPAVIDTATHDLTFPLRTNIACGRMAFTPNGLLAYLFSDGDFGEVYDLATRKIIAAFDLFGGNSTDVAITPDGRHVYVTQRPGKSAGGHLLVIDTATQRRIDPPIDVPGSADGLAFTPTGQIAYVSDRHSRAVHVVAARS
jgi:YVTN family beta-propeller protein